MPRCFCGEELADNQRDMCSACADAVEEAVADFDPPEGTVSTFLTTPVPMAGVVMPKDVNTGSVEED